MFCGFARAAKLSPERSFESQHQQRCSIHSPSSLLRALVAVSDLNSAEVSQKIVMWVTSNGACPWKKT